MIKIKNEGKLVKPEQLILLQLIYQKMLNKIMKILFSPKNDQLFKSVPLLAGKLLVGGQEFSHLEEERQKHSFNISGGSKLYSLGR